MRTLKDNSSCYYRHHLQFQQPSLLNWIQNDFYASFSVCEEIGLKGAKVSAYTVDPDFALVLEATTAADIAGVLEQNRVCELGNGAAISFMDGATSYDRELYNIAINSEIKVPSRSMPRTSSNGHLYTVVGDSIVKYKDTIKRKNVKLLKRTIFGNKLR